MYAAKKIALVIPALDEASNIRQVIESCPGFVDRIVVADNGSQDQTGDIAARSGAEVVLARTKGYGSACLSAIRHLEADPPDIVVFACGDGSDDLSLMDRLLDPIVKKNYDLVLGSRRLGRAEPGALTPMQKAGNWLATFLIDLIWAKKFTDLGPFRAIKWEALERLSMSDPDFGWTVEMQIKAARSGLRTKEVPVDYKRRQGGKSKVSGTVIGSLRAGEKILGWILMEAIRDRKYLSLGFISYVSIIAMVAAHVFNRPIFSIEGHTMYLADFMVFLLVFGFGVYRFFLKDHPYQKVRIHVIVWLYMIFWGVMPYVFGFKVPMITGGWVMWPAMHVVGSLMFFGYGFLMLFFGKRLDCGWNCPCVATRETVGFAFRRMTPKNRLWWRLRYLKYLSLAFMLIYLAWMLIDQAHAYNKVGHYYYTLLTESYYFSYLFLPLFGNRSYCRICCPYAALWGIYSRIGMYRIEADSKRCAKCGLCESVCDMGIPIRELIEKEGQINTVECMGCGRCVNVCPRGVLEIKSAWALVESVFTRCRKKCFS